MGRVTVTRWCMASLLVALCIWAINRAAHVGWASYQSIEARLLVKRWNEQSLAFDQLAWNRAREGFVTALEWDPENPAYHEGFADLYLVRLQAVPVGRELSRPFVQLALKHY